uniref:Uncharacterized protein n=1 Tax=Chromera velia CCMP2878 TaxID=1169474 RepID=A0A0G4HNF5_9ALVE|eukprot:Cvel_29433.t1-p1 / transcript=Cvel_29433.t1 / gene=Cvel_29433 / organism=Chromera_velia_CCMP2878 / gene_product=hypothetical protein / transcript_product=hypothetical protein / location=Cvel_scaffold4021:4609-5451(+) / protein_length=281 / sequence_SO=supercontig / SO=protein_coding / is_pseudo=false
MDPDRRCYAADSLSVLMDAVDVNLLQSLLSNGLSSALEEAVQSQCEDVMRGLELVLNCLGPHEKTANSVLWRAIQCNNCAAFPLLAKAGADPVSVRCALKVAIEQKHTESMKALISGGVCVTSKDWCPARSLLEWAVGDVLSIQRTSEYLSFFSELVHALSALPQGKELLNVRSKYFGDHLFCVGWKATCVQVAVHQGRPDVVEILVKAGADLSVHDGMSNTPMYLAAEKEDVQMLRTLVDLGAVWTPAEAQAWVQYACDRDCSQEVLDFLHGLVAGGHAG